MEKRLYLDQIPCELEDKAIEAYLESNFSNVRGIDLYISMGYVDFECDVQGEEEEKKAYLENFHKTDLDKFCEEYDSIKPYKGKVYKTNKIVGKGKLMRFEDVYSINSGEELANVTCYVTIDYWDDELQTQITKLAIFSKDGKRIN